jgi:hypothetical protein
MGQCCFKITGHASRRRCEACFIHFWAAIPNLKIKALPRWEKVHLKFVGIADFLAHPLSVLLIGGRF